MSQLSKLRRLSWALLSVFLVIPALPAAAQSASAIKVDLALFELMRDEQGRESFQPADRVKPGDTVEYRAAYRNTSNRSLRKVVATLPVPINAMAYLPDSAKPGGVQVSLDGEHFAAPPLFRNVTLPDGRKARREVPPGEYRYLRWVIDELPPQSSATLTARMQLLPVVSPVANAKAANTVTASGELQ